MTTSPTPKTTPPAGGSAGNDLSDPAQEDAFWRENFSERPYAEGGSYDDFGPAYAYGVSSYHAHSGHGHSFDDIETDMSLDWNNVKGRSRLSWAEAKHAVRDAWERLTR